MPTFGNQPYLYFTKDLTFFYTFHITINHSLNFWKGRTSTYSFHILLSGRSLSKLRIYLFYAILVAYTTASPNDETEILPKVQRSRGLSSAYQSNRSYNKFLQKSWSNFIFRIWISTKHHLQNLNQTSAFWQNSKILAKFSSGSRPRLNFIY